MSEQKEPELEERSLTIRGNLYTAFTFTERNLDTFLGVAQGAYHDWHARNQGSTCPTTRKQIPLTLEQFGDYLRRNLSIEGQLAPSQDKTHGTIYYQVINTHSQ